MIYVPLACSRQTDRAKSSLAVLALPTKALVPYFPYRGNPERILETGDYLRSFNFFVTA